ncbi:hypothetical protein Hdeb2414_s0003g00095881 [Helianthus debilis subsp. tardiflorus]
MVDTTVSAPPPPSPTYLIPTKPHTHLYWPPKQQSTIIIGRGARVDGIGLWLELERDR